MATQAKTVRQHAEVYNAILNCLPFVKRVTSGVVDLDFSGFLLTCQQVRLTPFSISLLYLLPFICMYHFRNVSGMKERHSTVGCNKTIEIT